MNRQTEKKLLGQYVSAIVKQSDSKTEKIYNGIVKQVTDTFIQLHDGAERHTVLFAGVDQGLHELINNVSEGKNPLIYRNNSVSIYENHKHLELEERNSIRIQGQFLF